MGTSIYLPLWLVVVLVVLSAAAVVQFFLLPGVRWYFRRKMNRVIDEVIVLLYSYRRGPSTRMAKIFASTSVSAPVTTFSCAYAE
mgnify:CR=1 FL=1